MPITRTLRSFSLDWLEDKARELRSTHGWIVARGIRLRFPGYYSIVLRMPAPIKKRPNPRDIEGWSVPVGPSQVC